MLSFRILQLFRVRNLGLHRTLQLSKVTVSTRCYSCINTLEDIQDPKQFNALVREFPRPKENLRSILYQVALKSQTLEWQPKFTLQRVAADAVSKKPMWKVQLAIDWPEKFVVEAVASQKNEAEKIAALLACRRLKDYGVLDEQQKPIVKDQERPVITNSKSVLGNIFGVVAQNFQSKHWHPQYVSQPLKVPGSNVKQQGWKSTLSVKWPKNHTVEGVGLRRVDAETVAATKALQWLREQNVLGQGDAPILYSQAEKKAFIESRRAPILIRVPENVRPMLKNVLQKYETLKPTIDEINDSNVLCDEEEHFRPLRNRHSQRNRSSELARRLESRMNSSDPNAVAMIQKQNNLPIFKKRKEILDLIEENQVVVLSGETGCGKTTQIPQYILDEEIRRMNGGNCNIVVTQPRRISAISIAHRIADERQESIGDTVGYQVRLQSKFPRGSGSILLCSTGVLLQRLHSDPSLENISHLIVDEIHERGVQTDFLLTLLKSVIRSNPNLKVVLMSATINSEMFSAYFNNCPMILVPGFMYPVTEHFLPDISRQLNTEVTRNPRYPAVDYNLVVRLIRHIDRSQPPGAILCFLPGWQDIKAIMERLEQEFCRSRSHLICPVHSRLPHDEQKLIFSPPKEGVRKIVLATNVAETSITIDDVVYVIDTGFHKETMYDAQRGVACLETQWISKANAKQRRGRAGRVQPGHCFRLYDQKTHQDFDEYPIPEIMRTPLEKVVLDCKLYNTNLLAVNFLSRAPQPPERETIEKAVYDLQQLNILDRSENLTPLGRKVASFSTHPRLSVALVVAAFFRCLSPVATMTAILSATRDPFHVSMDTREEIKQVKKKYDSNRYSDHLAMVSLFNDWEYADEQNDYNFCRSNRLHYHGLKFIKGLRELIYRDLQEANMVDVEKEAEDLYDTYSNSEGMILGALCAAVYPNVIRVYRGNMGKSTIKEKALVPVTLYGMQVAIPKESVVSKENNLPSPWLIYFHAMKSQQRRQIMVRDVSAVPSLLLFLCANQKTSMAEFGNDIHITVDDETRMKFTCPREDAQLLKNCQRCFSDLLWYYLATTSDSPRHIEEDSIEELKDNFLAILNKIFQSDYSNCREIEE